MTENERATPESQTPNPNREVDAEAVDLGDDVRRTPGNQDSTLDQAQHTGLEGGIDPAATDLGSDVYRTS